VMWTAMNTRPVKVFVSTSCSVPVPMFSHSPAPTLLRPLTPRRPPLPLRTARHTLPSA
jgi:hypothetical protein